jgi:hypothetical protein
MAVAYYLVDRYVKPLHAVSEAAQGVALGRLDPIPFSSGPREIGKLTQNFNEMLEKLKRSREREEELSRVERFAALGRLAGGIAHEIKNPLNFISLSIDRLRQNFSPAEKGPKAAYHQQIAEIKEEIHRLSRLVENFLHYGRPVKIHPRPELIEPILEEVLSLARPKLEEGAIRVELQMEPDLPPLRLDREKVRACLLNVVVNSIQAMPDGGSLTIEACATPAGDGVDITLSDTGYGIDPSELPRVFDPFYTTKETGIGLGLSLTKEILEQHGGSVALGNREDGGTRVRFTFRTNPPQHSDGEGQRSSHADPRTGQEAL